jgi:FkbH-like protein
MTAGTRSGADDATRRRMLLVGDTTLDPLARMLERSTEVPELCCAVAPYGQIYQILLDASHPVWEFRPDYVVVWTAPHLTLPSVAKLLQFEQVNHEHALREVEQFADALLQAASHVPLVLVPSWILPGHERWIQMLTWRQGSGLANLLARANLLLSEKLSKAPNVFLLDAGYWQASLGRPTHDPRMYAVSKILYSQALLVKAAAEIKAALRGSLGLGRKVIVCDLDNTLWGGVAADDGPHAIKLGAPDPVGECFSSFQVALKGLSSRGILLAICSKNEEQFALSVIEDHPSMVLRKSDFVGWRINWKDKAENIQSLAAELNLGLDSFVFIDDSPQEREQIRQMLPQVYTPDPPASPADFAPFVLSLPCFETVSLGSEDLKRTHMYQAERGRKEALESVGDVETWLSSLQIAVRVAPLRQESLTRAAQLLNKTNQFNLSLRRMDETVLWNWASAQGNDAYVFHVSDRFGDSGLTGLVSVSHEGPDARIVDFVMSCRVMGKKVEEALLAYAFERARAAGADRLSALPVEGPRNAPVREFFAKKYMLDAGAAIDRVRVAMPLTIHLTEED